MSWSITFLQSIHHFIFESILIHDHLYMLVAMTSMISDSYGEVEQRDRLSKLAKWQWLELDATFDHVFLAHQYLN